MTLWLYLLSDHSGAWPVLREDPLPPGRCLCGGTIRVELHGRFTDPPSAWRAFHVLEGTARERQGIGAFPPGG
jgi:hypothetical protein